MVDNNAQIKPIYKVRIKGQIYRTTISDPFTPVFLSLVNLNSPKVNSVLSQLQVKIVLDGKQLFPSPHGTFIAESLSHLTRFLGRLLNQAKTGQKVGSPGKEVKAPNTRSSYQVQKPRRAKKGAK